MLMAKSNTVVANKAKEDGWQICKNSVLVICSLFCLTNSPFIINIDYNIDQDVKTSKIVYLNM